MRPSRCALLETVTTRSLIRSSSRPVSAKCPKWLVPTCSSKPSLVRRNGVAITPALLTSTAICPVPAANSPTEARSARSRRRTSALPGIPAAARSPLAVSRQATTTCAPARASSVAVTAPNPLFAPVTTIVRPV